MTAMWGVRRIVQADDTFVGREFLNVRKKILGQEEIATGG
jgi:hypothetical protein